MQEPQMDPVRQQPLNDAALSAGKAEWQTPAVTEISRFEILSVGPSPGTQENFTYSDKSG
jgi:hypothetical protein